VKIAKLSLIVTPWELLLEIIVVKALR